MTRLSRQPCDGPSSFLRFSPLSPQITLYTHALSPFGMKVYWALVFKRLQFAVVWVTPGVPEIAFTGQRVVPVVTIGDDWRLDSTAIAQWLDDRYSDRPLTGTSTSDRERIAAVDRWANERLIPAFFRQSIDYENPWNALRNGFILASTMRQTAGRIPRYLDPFWSLLLRRADFIRRNVEMVAEFRTMAELNEVVLRELEAHIGEGPFLGGREAPSLADASVFAQAYAAIAKGLRGGPDYCASSTVVDWMRAIDDERAACGEIPVLFPGMPDRIVSP